MPRPASALTPGDAPQGVVELRSASARVAVDLRRGAKITSLLDLRTGREWLLAGPVPPAPLPEYGDAFTSHPVYGWDETYPTVDACSGLAEPFGRADLPDHGEVWARPWRVDEWTPNDLECSIEGVGLPYRLHRRLQLTDSTLTLRYTAQTSGQAPVPALWAAHPQFAAAAGTVMRLPSAVTSLEASPEGEAGRPRFVVPVTPAGIACEAVVERGSGLMLYADPSALVEWACLADRSGTWLRMAWERRDLPYFAAWMDNGMCASAPVICPEPTTAYVDSLQRAEQTGRLRHIKPGEALHWALELTLGRS